MNYVTTEYSLKDNGKINVLNQGVTKDGNLKSTERKAYVKNTKYKLGELRISFFWIFYAKYRIIYLDESYETTVVRNICGYYLESQY